MILVFAVFVFVHNEHARLHNVLAGVDPHCPLTSRLLSFQSHNWKLIIVLEGVQR